MTSTLKKMSKHTSKVGRVARCASEVLKIRVNFKILKSCVLRL